MKDSLKELEQFISDFNLRRPDGVIAFPATVHFDNNGQTIIEQSEVHIITSDNIGAIYFLNLDGQALPDMFSVKDQQFTYSAGRGLTIEGPAYKVAVFPKTKNTAEE